MVWLNPVNTAACGSSYLISVAGGFQVGAGGKAAKLSTRRTGLANTHLSAFCERTNSA